MLSLGHYYASNGLLLPLYIFECLLNKTLNNIFIDFLVVFFIIKLPRVPSISKAHNPCSLKIILIFVF